MKEKTYQQVIPTEAGFDLSCEVPICHVHCQVGRLEHFHPELIPVAPKPFDGLCGVVVVPAKVIQLLNIHIVQPPKSRLQHEYQKKRLYEREKTDSFRLPSASLCRPAVRSAFELMETLRAVLRSIMLCLSCRKMI